MGEGKDSAARGTCGWLQTAGFGDAGCRANHLHLVVKRLGRNRFSRPVRSQMRNYSSYSYTYKHTTEYIATTNDYEYDKSSYANDNDNDHNNTNDNW